MDRARGKFYKRDSDSPRDGRSGSDGSRGSYHSASNSPRPGPSMGGSRSNSPRSHGGNGNGGQRPKRSRESPEHSRQGVSLKRQRSEAAHGTSKKRQPRYDLDVTKPENSVKTGHGSDAARDQQIVRLKANYFRLTNRPDFKVYQYHVDIEPEIGSTAAKKGIFYEVTKDIRCGKFFDGTTLYTTQKLDQDPITIAGNRRTRNNEEDTAVIVKIKFIKEISSFQELPMFQVLNTVLRQALHGLKLQLVGRNYFDAVASNAIQQLRVEVWPGYITSIRQHDQGVLMCCETTSKVMRNESLYEILRRCQGHRDYKDVFTKEVLGATVLTDYNNKTYRVDDVDWDSTPMSTFETKNGPKSYMQYYGERYHINIRDKRQPLILSRSKEKNRRGGEQEIIALIPELCRATGITDEMRSNRQTMKALSDFTRLNPTHRVERLLRFSNRIRQSEESTNALSKLGMQVASDLIDLESRLLRKPDAYLGDTSEKMDRYFDKCLRNKLYRPGALENWFVISTGRDARNTGNFVQSVKRSVNFHIAEPQYVTLQRDQIDELIRKIDSCIHNDPQLIMIIAPTNQADRYQAIKKKCCIERAVPTQVVCAKTLNNKNLMSVATKVAVQMSCKLGGAPWGIKIPLTGMLIIGYDVSYDTKDKKRSFGALVASMDQFQSIFFSVVSEHEENEQLSNKFTYNVMQAVKEFEKVNGARPTKLLIYRDGVGDGQIRHVLDHEKDPLARQLHRTFGEDFRFAFIIVNKKTNTRLFTASGGRANNPEPGTVVDTVITLPERYDFYLVPTSVRQGTVSPVYFNVIYDTLGLPAARLQQLTYFLCHGYYNWTAAIAVPAVCKYAAKLAFLCSQHLHAAPNIWQDKRLYFL